MSIVALILILVFLGVVLYFVNTSTKMVGWMKTIINILCIIIAVILILQAFGVWQEIRSAQVPHI